MSAIDYLQLSKAAKVAAAECIAMARRADPQCHHTQRHVEILAIDATGERIEPPLDYIDVKEISGKRLHAIITFHAPAQYHSITVQGGLDCYPSFQYAMQNPDDYEPMTDTWEVDSADPEAATVTRAERIKDHRQFRPQGPTTPTAVEMFTPANYKGFPQR